MVKSRVRTKQEFVSAIIEAWVRDESMQETFKELIVSIDGRVKEVIKPKGTHTKY